MNHYKNTLKMTALGLALVAGQAFAHGNVTPQAVDTKGLENLGEEWRDTNPYREGHPQHDLAIQVGASAYNQNCAACHGLDGISGGSPAGSWAAPGPWAGRCRPCEGLVRPRSHQQPIL